MITLRPALERGQTRIAWLESRHSFSFGEYDDPAHRGFHSLRVINEDWVAPGQGFGMHPHRDMEILTWVLAGQLAHRDSLGTGSTIGPGELQRMSAGTGIRHSEINPSPTEPVQLLQIWIHPNQRGLPPGYDQRLFPVEGRLNRWQLLASPTGRDGSLSLAQDVDLWAAELLAGESLTFALPAGRAAWAQITAGHGRLNDQPFARGDGLAVENTETLAFQAESPVSLLLFDLG